MNILKTIGLMAAIFAGSIASQAQSFTVALKSGEKVTYKNADVDSIYFHEDEPEPTVDPKIGDFYYSDGTWSTALNTEKTPIGIVFRIGIASDANDAAAFYTCKDRITPLGEFHGYVMSLNDATTDADGVETPVWWSPFKEDEGAGCSTNISDFLGYTNTLSIIAAGEKDGGLSATNYPAGYAAVNYESTCPAPESSSGWFMPSAGQMKYIYDRVYFDEDGSGRACLANSFEKLPEGSYQPLYRRDAEYWTSTEKVDAYGYSTWAYYFCFDSSMFKPGFVADYRKNANNRVRAILAF